LSCPRKKERKKKFNSSFFSKASAPAFDDTNTDTDYGAAESLFIDDSTNIDTKIKLAAQM